MEALYYTHEGERVRCGLCAHHCLIAKSHRGRCGSRYYDGEKLLALNAGQCTSAALDPIEKKPLIYFHPGSLIVSLGSWGCNFTCPFCQNWTISQEEAPSREMTPQDAAALAKRYVPQGNIGLAYTYNEPTLSYEFILPTAKLIKEIGLCNVMVSNGYIAAAPRQELLPYIDAWNIDLKGFSERFYQKMCGASLRPVLETIEAAAAVSHVEVTTLIIPGENDSPEEMDAEARWLAAISPDLPLHLSRYFPRWHWTAPATPMATLQKLRAVASQYLHFVYLGNV